MRKYDIMSIQGVFMKKYKVGSSVEGTVTGIENYGIFVSIDKDYSGLIHISEISADFVRDVNDYVKVGEKVNSKIIEIDDANNQLKLSLKDTLKDNGLAKSIHAEDGFNSLKERLPRWMEDKIEELKEND